VQLLTAATDPNFLPVLEQAKALGVHWVRVYLPWSSIQPNSPSDWSWSYPDKLFGGLAAQGLIPIVTITGNPAWAASNPTGPVDPAHLSDFGNFVSALVQHYPDVQFWEFYNEPDEWPQAVGRGWGGSGDQYAAMLRTAYDAIHPDGAAGAGRDPQYVVFGGVAYETGQTCPDLPKGQCFDYGFIGDVLDNSNGSPPFDVMAFHYYDAFAGNYTPPNIVGKALKLKRVYPQLKDKPFIVTELGKSYQFGANANFSHELAARREVQIFASLMAGADPAYDVNIAAGIWYTLEHYEEPTGGAPRMWGLLDTAGAPWPMEGAAWATTVAELGDTRYVNQIAGAPGVEGYNFAAADGSVHSVLWATRGSPQYAVQSQALRRLDVQGNAATVLDGGAGDADPRPGWVGLQVTSSPIFVENPATSPSSSPSATPLSSQSPALIWAQNSFVRQLQARILALVCQIFHLPCKLS
jgi:hypothetical protein